MWTFKGCLRNEGKGWALYCRPVSSFDLHCTVKGKVCGSVINIHNLREGLNPAWIQKFDLYMWAIIQVKRWLSLTTASYHIITYIISNILDKYLHSRLCRHYKWLIYTRNVYKLFIKINIFFLKSRCIVSQQMPSYSIVSMLNLPVIFLNAISSPHWCVDTYIVCAQPRTIN